MDRCCRGEHVEKAWTRLREGRVVKFKASVHNDSDANIETAANQVLVRRPRVRRRRLEPMGLVRKQELEAGIVFIVEMRTGCSRRVEKKVMECFVEES
jgi:hypothetical protein